MTSLLVGATGLVGRECLRLLLEDDAYEPVHVLTRRPIDGLSDSPRVIEHVIDFDAFIASGVMPAVDHVFCALGTTMAKAGSKAAFRNVDFHYPLRIAEMALQAGAQHFVLVSAAGSSTKSPFFYSRVKGELEEAISGLGYASFSILRPSWIAGDREEHRPAEQFALRWFNWLPGSLRPVRAEAIAAKMLETAKEGRSGTDIISSKDLTMKSSG